MPQRRLVSRLGHRGSPPRFMSERLDEAVERPDDPESQVEARLRVAWLWVFQDAQLGVS